jgi:hypothetical protein
LFKQWSPGVRRGHNRENNILKQNNLLQNQLANFNQTWYKSFLGNRQIKGQVFFKREIIITMKKMGWGHLEIFFLRTTEPE